MFTTINKLFLVSIDGKIAMIVNNEKCEQYDYKKLHTPQNTV